MVHMGSLQNTASAAAARAAVIVSVASTGDLADVYCIQQDGFGRVAARFGIDPADMAPLRETLDDLLTLNSTGVVTFIARSGADAAGTVRARLRDDGVVEIGRLAVAGAFVRRGVATALMLAVEEHFATAKRFELYTGAEAVEPLALYDRLGYRIFRTEEHGAWRAVWLAKDRPDATVPDGAPLHWSS
jgi:ribosomal protein S18 acetylase RimI-like enzyme